MDSLQVFNNPQQSQQSVGSRHSSRAASPSRYAEHQQQQQSNY